MPNGTFAFTLISCGYGRDLWKCIVINIKDLTSIVLQAEQIQAEFKVLALQYHPDKNNGDKDAETKFQKLKVSWSPWWIQKRLNCLSQSGDCLEIGGFLV